VFFLSLAVVRTDNFCSGERAGGLIANLFCLNPSTGEPWGDDNKCENKAAKTQVCCINPDQVSECPIAKAVSYDNNEDYEYDYGSRVTFVQKQQEERLCPVVDGTLWESCTYNVDEFTDDIERQCTTLEELNEFAACQQGCDEIHPDEIPTTIPEEPTDNFVDDDYDYAFLGARTDAIGVTQEKRCGTREFEEVVLPENQAIMGEFPWACSVFTDEGARDGKYLGGCTIIPNERDNDITKPTYRVITAAHKLDGVGANAKLKVRVRFTDNRNAAFEDDHLVTQFISHPEYISDRNDRRFNKAQRFANNIVTMVLEKPINLVEEKGVNAACLPGCNDMFDHTFKNHTGVRCWSAGFGAQDKGGQNEFVLRKVDIPIFPDRQKCERIMEKARREASKGRIPTTRLHPGEICAGGEKDKDTCSGDGGSPLVCQAVSGRWHVVGLVSWGIGCGVEGRPAVYTNVFHYLDFIYSLIGPCSDGNWYNKDASRNPIITCPGEGGNGGDDYDYGSRTSSIG